MCVFIYESVCLCIRLLKCVKEKERPRERRNVIFLANAGEYLLNGFRNITFSLTKNVDVLKVLV